MSRTRPRASVCRPPPEADVLALSGFLSQIIHHPVLYGSLLHPQSICPTQTCLRPAHQRHLLCLPQPRLLLAPCDHGVDETASLNLLQRRRVRVRFRNRLLLHQFQLSRAKMVLTLPGEPLNGQHRSVARRGRGKGGVRSRRLKLIQLGVQSPKDVQLVSNLLFSLQTWKAISRPKRVCILGCCGLGYSFRRP